MPLHALAIAKPPPSPALFQNYAFDPALPARHRALLERLLSDLIRVDLMPRIASCCCFNAELVAGLLRHNGIAARAVPCRLTIRTPAGYALIGEGFARPGQIDGHFVTLSESLLVDWALGATRTVPGLDPLPLGISVRRRVEQSGLGSVRLSSTHHLLWETVEASAEVTRLHMAEKLKAARLLNQVRPKRGLRRA